MTPTTATYAFSYPIGLTPPSNALNYPLGIAGNTTLQDNLDGSADGTVAVGADMSWSGAGTVELLGVTVNGDPIILDTSVGPGFYTILSNNGALVGQPIEVSAATEYIMCFLRDTMIATPSGEVAVQDLACGDQILTARGGRVAIKWIGHKTIHTRFGAAERLMPVRFAAGALGQGLPHRDLTVTTDHAMLVQGVLCNAGALVNCTTITRVPLAQMGARFTVYHIETPQHDIILANGAMSETFIDAVSRRAFDNFADYAERYGAEAPMRELSLPRAMTARQVPGAIRQGLAKTTKGVA